MKTRRVFKSGINLCDSLFIILLFTQFNQTMAADRISIFHYNIKELDSAKIRDHSDQIKAVKSILSKYQFDFLSLNEVQYDFKNVPDSSFKTQGKNVRSLLKQLGQKRLKNISFNPANTGKNAKKKPDGSYYLKPHTAEARAHADHFNFGTVPGQYSTAAATKLPMVKEVVISKLKWKDFNPNADFSKYKTPAGQSFPDDMLLFDKNFTDITVKVGEKELHLILLHTVPSFHFGNKKSINYFRNAEQLRFLEWYTTGKTDYSVNLNKIKPLTKNAYYIAMGDLNVDFKNLKAEGGPVLDRVIKKTNPWVSTKQMNFTKEGGGYGPKPMRLMLDYILASKNIKIIKGQIIHPDFKRKELGCKKDPGLITSERSDMIIEEYTKGGKTCSVMITPEYKIFKDASDHYPLYGEFELK